MKLPPRFLLFATLLLVPACGTLKNSPPAPGGQSAHKLVTERRQVLAADYLVFLPRGYGTNAARRWPLILFLHGAGERGDDVWRVAKHGPPKVAPQLTNFPFIVVSPQCPKGKIWSNDLLLALLDEVENAYDVDPHRVYLTGISMGGFGTWSLGMSHPEKFAAIAPICGGGDFITAHLADRLALTTLPVWAFHGAKDTVVPLEESQRMVNLLKKLGAKEVKFTVYPNAGHECWNEPYAGPELYDWFLKHAR